MNACTDVFVRLHLDGIKMNVNNLNTGIAQEMNLTTHSFTPESKISWIFSHFPCLLYKISDISSFLWFSSLVVTLHVG